ncbi:MAG: dUTP diphosphatase [Bacillota bacterium]
MKRDNIKLPFKRIRNTEDLPQPSYMTSGSAGMDICAAVEADIEVKPGNRTLIPTGLAVAVPTGYELQIRPRSGLAVKQGIGILNSPGTIDSDYRGEIKVILINLGDNNLIIKRGDRIAQMVLCPVPRAVLEEMNELPPTERNDGGFGHTG